MKTDSLLKSLAQGRVGIVLLAVVSLLLKALNIEVSEEDQKTLIDSATQFLSNFGILIAGVAAAWSKGKELYKKSQEGSSSISLIYLVHALCIVVFIAAPLLFISCSGVNKTIPQQIAEQGGTALDVNKGVYLEATAFLKEANNRVAEQLEILPEATYNDPTVIKWVTEVNKILDDASVILKDWKLAIDTTDAVAAGASSEEWRMMRNKLIQKAMTIIITTK